MTLSATPLSFVPAAARAIALLLLLPIAGALQAQNNVPIVAGHFTNTTATKHWDITLFATRLPNGNVIGWVSLAYEFDDGTTTYSRYVEEPVDEFVIQGDIAYVRAGMQYLALRDNGAGANAAPDEFLSVYFISPPYPPLAAVQGFMTMMMAFNSKEVTTGGLEIRS